MTTIALKKIIVASAKMTQKLVVGGNATGTAPASEVLEGSTFSNMYAVDLVGTMPNIGAQNITPSATEQTISEGYHDGSGKVAGDADLVAENIKKDVQIFGVTGTLESGTAATGNATVSQVLSGATFSNATSNDLTGTMPNIGAQNITPSASNQSISAGYHNGSGVVAGDADLTAGNIKKNVAIFGVTGTYEGDTSAIKSALDAANEEVSADVDAAIALVDANYGEISAAIAAAGVSMTGVKPSGYDARIGMVGDSYKRPSFWPAMPELTENSLKASILVAVFPKSQNAVNLRVDGSAWSVDWGDSSSESGIPSANARQKEYDYDIIAGDANVRGYKCVIINITASTAMTFLSTPSATGTASGPNILEIVFAPTVGATNVSAILICPLLEIFTLIGKPRWNSGYFQNNLPMLKRVNIDTSGCITAASNWRKSLVNSAGTFEISNPLNYSAAAALDAAFYQAQIANGELIIIAPKQSFTASAMIQSSKIRKLVFDDFSFCTNTTSAFASTELAVLRVPGIKISFSVASCNMSYAAIVDLIGDLYPGVTAQTLTITGNPGAAAIMAAIAAGTITVPAGWTVTM